MNSPKAILARLDAIADSLSRRDSALALLGLGSVGIERHRLDQYSDIDFFAIVKEGSKSEYLTNLDWMADAHPIAWAFQNTKDGHKLLYEDGIFCEYAVFEPEEMAEAHHPGGKLIWQRPEFDRSICVPRHLPKPQPPAKLEWIIGEALSNLHVGLCRYLRGEKWTAALFVQNYALARVADLITREETAAEHSRDPYGIDRRFESRHPKAETVFARCMQGYSCTPESARAILEFIEKRYEVNATLKSEILKLCEAAENS